MKTAKTWSVTPDNKYYPTFFKKAQAGDNEIKLTDGVDYSMSIDQNKNIILVAKDCGMPMKKKDMKKDTKKDMGKKCENSEEIKKESQSVSPKSVKTLVDDKDINQTSGPGQGKTHVDKAHSLAVDEKKPSEGMSEPSVPEAPNGGQLAREHTVEKATDGPNIPAGGGMNPDYDQNEKNTPEKQDQITGKQNDAGATASNRENAVKIAGQMLKAQMISIDELPNKINELSKATPEILKDYENLIRQAQETKGLRRTASANSVETPIVQKSAGATNEAKSQLKDNVQSLFTLNSKNNDYERYTKQSGDPRLYR